MNRNRINEEMRAAERAFRFGFYGAKVLSRHGLGVYSRKYRKAARFHLQRIRDFRAMLESCHDR